MDAGAYDAVIIGGGPAGSSAATFLARAGRRVLVLEKEQFPRFHVGESLLPYNRRLFEDMGVLERLEAAGFPRKHGAQFHLGNGSASLKLAFRNGCFTREPEAFQVERSQFDHLLLQHAESCGAEVRQPWTVGRVQANGATTTVEASPAKGDPVQVRAAYVLDCSGRANLTGTQEGQRVMHKDLRKIALYSHFTGVQRDAGTENGDTIIVRLEAKWFWLIPVAADKVSVGLVLDQDEFVRHGGSPGGVFQEAVQSSAVMRERMARARAVRPVQVTTDFSYYNRRLVGPRLLRVGDAAGFMDPIFSAGVYLAMHSGRLAADAVQRALADPGRSQQILAAYEKRVSGALRYYWRLSKGFYDPAFLELFMQPRRKFQVPDAVLAILAGELDGGWALRWRRELFFLLVRLQQWLPLVPPLSFQAPPGGPAR